MIIAFTGAGVSKESGIDTFQDRPGIRDYLVRSYAKKHPEKYREVMREFMDTMVGKEPNDAHKALAEYGIPVITMNVDILHEMAGTTDIVKLHGRLPTEEEWPRCDKLYNTPVLYEDPAPMYQKGYDWIFLLEPGDVFLVIGASDYTTVSSQMRICARGAGARVVEIQDNAGTKVRAFLENNKDKMDTMENFLKRIEKYER